MNKVMLTVMFEDPFWIGVFEKDDGKSYEAAKVTFGSEPKDYEVYDFVLRNYDFIRFGKTNGESEVADKKINPKRLQKQIKKSLSEKGIGTKAQNALKEQIASQKEERKKFSKQKKADRKEEQFLLRQQKKKQKQKGR